MIRWMWLFLLALPAWGNTTTTSPADADTQATHTQTLRDQFEEAKRVFDARGAAIDAELKQIKTAFDELEPQSGEKLSVEKAQQRNRLAKRKATLEKERTFWEGALRSRQSAIDFQEFEIQTLRELELFNAEAAQKTIYFGPAEIAALKAELDLSRTLLDNIERSNATRRQRLTALQEKLDHEEFPQNRDVLLAERAAINSQLDSTRENQENQQAQIRLLEAKLKLVSPMTAAATRSATGPAGEKQAESKRKLSEFIRQQARGDFEKAKEQLRIIAQEVEKVHARGGSDYARLRYDREYWLRKRSYESRRLRQADSEGRIASETNEVVRIEAEIEDAAAEKTSLQKEKLPSAEERTQRADEYKKRSDETRKAANAVEDRVVGERPNPEVSQRLNQSIDATDKVLLERLDQAVDFEHYSQHYSRMKELLDNERQQINYLMNSSAVVTLTLMRQAVLLHNLADIYVSCAEVLVPPQPSFWERNAAILQSIRLVLIAFFMTYAVQMLVWLGQRVTRHIGRNIVPGRFSVKRVETLFSFFGSITQLFIWLFTLVLVLNEFGLDPAKSTGAIGLIGLVLAGMFQNLVIDFVKGLDIITGRHYNVGDFVELDGKTGHVIDFSIKHTRIRTASGQEYNLPNSRCIPSRRFPDGYVDNYVDIVLKTTADIVRAKRAVAPVCHNISRRIEQVKDEAVFVDRLPGTRPNSVILRYRVRVLPACEWIITSQFIPDVKAALEEEGIELTEEPTFFFINRIQTFRQLFSSELSEEEILREVHEQEDPLPEKPSETKESVTNPPESTAAQANHQ